MNFIKQNRVFISLKLQKIIIYIDGKPIELK